MGKKPATNLNRQLNELANLQKSGKVEMVTNNTDMAHLKNIQNKDAEEGQEGRPLIEFNMKMAMPGSAVGTTVMMNVKMPVGYPLQDTLKVSCKGMKLPKDASEKLNDRQQQQLNDDVEDYMVSSQNDGQDAVRTVATFAQNRTVQILSE